MCQEWELKRNCSLTPRQCGMAYGLLAVFTLLVSLRFALVGYWFVIAFAVLELGALMLALLHYARHATDREHIALSDDCVLVERIEAGQVHTTRLERCWTRIVLPDRKRNLIRLESRGVQVEVGGFVTEARRRQVAKELRQELRNSSFVT